MNGSHNEVIKIAAGIGLTLLLVGLGFGIYFVFSGKIGKLIEDGGKTIDQATVAVYTEKNNETLSGSTVLNFIKDREAHDDQIPVIVNNGGSVVSYVYDASFNKIASNTESDLIKSAKSKGNAAYINPAAKYDCTVQSDEANGITSITFTRQ